jgi:hypothetical protein
VEKINIGLIVQRIGLKPSKLSIGVRIPVGSQKNVTKCVCGGMEVTLGLSPSGQNDREGSSPSRRTKIV